MMLRLTRTCIGVSKIVKSQIESNSQHWRISIKLSIRCVKDRQITNWKQFTTMIWFGRLFNVVCQRSSNHKLKAIHNSVSSTDISYKGVSKIVKSQIESNSQLWKKKIQKMKRCVKDRQITNWKQFTTAGRAGMNKDGVCQRSSNHKLKAIHNTSAYGNGCFSGVSKIVKSQIESNSQPGTVVDIANWRCVKDRQITNWKQFTTAGC